MRANRPIILSISYLHITLYPNFQGTASGIYDLRLLQIKRSGRLGPRAVLALDCCLPALAPSLKIYRILLQNPINFGPLTPSTGTCEPDFIT